MPGCAKNYPETLLVGPSNTCDNAMGPDSDTPEEEVHSGGVASVMGDVANRRRADGWHKGKAGCVQLPLLQRSFRASGIHYAGRFTGDVSAATTEPYLAVAGRTARLNVPARDKYCPEGQMWVTESGDAGGGGDTWASTYLDVFRTLNELGEFATVTDGVIFHNTLASSDYGFSGKRSFLSETQLFRCSALEPPDGYGSIRYRRTDPGRRPCVRSQPQRTAKRAYAI